MSYVLSFRMVFFYLVTTGWIFDNISLCENSINQSINNFLCREGGGVTVRHSLLFPLFPVQLTTSGIGHRVK